MNILGVSCYYHDAAAALLVDGQLVAAAEEERFSRKKHDSGFPQRAIDFCLQMGGLEGGDLDYVVFYEKPFLKFERNWLTTLKTFPRSHVQFRESTLAWISEKLWIRSQLHDALGLPFDRILFVDHHLSHAASCFLCSPFEEAAVLTVDGVGEWTTTAVGYGRDNEVALTREMRFPHSLGLLYSAFTAFLGFQVNEGEYKVMGMAPYGEPKYVDKVHRVLDIADDGSFHLNMDYFAFHYSATDTFNEKFVELFGEPRQPESPFMTTTTNPGCDPNDSTVQQSQYYADIAASIQLVTEEILLRLARSAHESTGLKNLCMAGGVALNSVANGRIQRESPFESLYIQPAAGDSGGAVGAALYAYHCLLGQPRSFIMNHAYWGAEHDAAAIRAALDEAGLRYTECSDHDQLIERTVDALVAGKVIGWQRGRFEWGPRALGNRSILADPRRGEMKGIVNEKIKFREPFRPFAPAVIEDRAEEFFHLDGRTREHPFRFMLVVSDVPEDKRAVIPAVTHAGGNARLQTVRREWNDAYYDVIQRFGEATGVPVVLNTSFNVRGEPIVNTPADAIHTFTISGLDCLAIEPFFVTKDENSGE